MSFVHTKEDVLASGALALAMAEELVKAESMGVAVDAMLNVLTSYLLAACEGRVLTSGVAEQVVDDFHAASKARLAGELLTAEGVLAPKAVH